MNKGLHGLHVALRMGDYYYSPAQFAVAWIAVTERPELSSILESVVDKILSNNYDTNRTPLLAELVKKKEENGERFNIKTLEEIAKKSYGTSKIIRNNGAVFTDDNGDTENVTIRQNVFANVDTRGKRTAKNPAYKVSLFNALLINDLEYAKDRFKFQGGTPDTLFRSDELSYWSKGIRREARHLENIEKNFGADAIKHYQTHIDIVDSGVAQVLIKLNDELEKNNRGDPRKLISIEPKVNKSLLPFDFNNAPDLAIESFLRVNHGIKSRNKGKTRDKRYISADTMLFEHMDEFTPKEYIDLRKKGKTTIEVFISGKYLPKNDFSWAMMQALENHMHRKGRIFTGYTLEKIGDNYFIAAAFKNTSRAERQTSVRILYDDMFYPVVLYKTSTNDDLRMGTDAHPMKLLNFSKPRNNYDIIWRDVDLRSGKKTINEIFEPLPELMSEGAQIMFDNGIRFIDGTKFSNSEEMQRYILGKYIERRKEYSHANNPNINKI
jgi:hypothetical protein